MIQWYQKLSIPVSIPILKDHDSLELSFSFYTEDPYYRVWAYLAAESVHLSCPVKLKISRFSVETKEEKLKEGFRINRLIIHNKKDAGNTLFLDVHRPVAEKELPLLRGDVPSLGESRDYELISLALRPFLPPVAHAGGSYQGMTYTNSVEALKRNVGVFNFFEIDFEWSKDNRLICLHDWENTFTRLFGFAVEGPLDYSALRKLKTTRDITPLTLFTINEFLSSNPEAKIVTDVKSSNIDALRKIAGFFPDFAERFIPQVYQPGEFAETIEIGYKNIIWTLYRYRHIYDPARILSHIRTWEDKYDVKPFAVTMPVTAAEKGVAYIVAEAGIPVYAHASQ